MKVDSWIAQGVPHRTVDNDEGTYHIFPNEYEAQEFLDYYGHGVLVCYGGFLNAVYVERKDS